jgi:antitoxin HicB
MMERHFSLNIQWSDADRRFLVTIPEFEAWVMQPCTSGKSYQEAVENAQTCIDTLIEHFQDEGMAVPLPQIYAVAQVA